MTVIMSKKDQPLCEYVCSNLNNTIEIINAMSTEGVDDDEEIILYILNSEQVNEETKEIIANVMGPIQIQVLKHIIKERFDMDVEFGTGSILYKETINNIVEGVGHFEPLKHYAEVHLLMEPGQLGSGITFESNLNESLLSRNWQRLIMTHLAEKEHKQVRL